MPQEVTTSAPADTNQYHDFAEVVVPIASVRIAPSLKVGITGTIGPKLNLDANFGTGFCLDAPCRFVITNYHVALMTPASKIKKEQIIRRYLATGPHEDGATSNDMSNGARLAFVVRRDLAMFELRHSLAGYHGIGFSFDELHEGQVVDIYGYPRGEILAPLRKLTRFRATFKAPTTSGLLAFEYQLSGNKPMHVEGTSGGIIVDRTTQKIVAIMCRSNATMAEGVSVQTLIRFVSKVQPFLAEEVFPVIRETEPSLVSGDLHPKFVPDRLKGRRPTESREVTSLREKAQVLADSMQNFMAVQEFDWGSGDNEPSEQANYEVRVLDGAQRWRRYPDGKRDSEEVPVPHQSIWVSPADEWADLPNMVGSDLRLKVRQAEDLVLNGRRLKVFQYHSDVEDNLCPWNPHEDFGLFSLSKIVAVACYGEVWTDEDANIIRMSEHLDLSDKLKSYRGWNEYEVVLTYGWFERGTAPSILVPLTIFTQGRYKNQIVWCRGHFTAYKVFTTQSRLIVNKAEIMKTLGKPTNRH